jgi:ribosomal protein S18 acetylase RimI-like enzyme
MSNAQITLASSAQAAALARIHFESLPDDYLPSLGQDFLEKEYYPAALQSTVAATYVALVGQHVAGFVTVAFDSPAFTREFMQGRMGKMAYYAIRATLRNPAHLLQSAQVFLSAAGSKPDPIPAEIVFIAVDAAYRNRGIGKQLVVQSLEYLHTQGVPQCRTKTLAQNMGVIAMYERLGWRVRNRFRFIGREYVILVGDSKGNDFAEHS